MGHLLKTLNNSRHGYCTTSRGGAAKFGFISITYHQYIFGLYKYILRLEISIFDRENNKNRQELRIIISFRDIQSGRGTTINVGYWEIFSLSNILISPIHIPVVPYDLLRWKKMLMKSSYFFLKGPPFGYFWTETLFISIFW